MSEIKGAKIDEHLLSGQQEDKLVIFAGAGVSMGHPSDYPDFRRLAGQIARGSKLKLSANEPIEHFLGRLCDEGLHVHEKAAEILSNPNSRPKPLHRDLLRLYAGNPERLRIVTTNMDTHFGSGARELFGQTPIIFKAPALPLGNDFTGIVHLH